MRAKNMNRDGQNVHLNNKKENDLLLELSEPIELIWFNPNGCKESSLFMKCCSVNLNLSGVTTARMSNLKL